MNAEQRFFLQILTDHIHGRQSSAPTNLSWELIRQYAVHHQLEPIFFLQTGREEFRSTYYRQIMYSDVQSQIYESLEKKLADLPHFILKGPIIAAYYPVKEVRTMGDMDYVVHPEDKEKAHDLLTEFGFELTHASTGEWEGEREYEYKHILIELHTALVYEYSDSTSDLILRDFFNGCWAYYKDGKIDFNFHVLFLFMHLRKHIMETGVGFRQFMDIAILTDKAEVDWNWVRDKASETGLLPFVQTVLSLNEKWFHIASPIDKTEIDSEFFEKATKHIFNDGVFGFNNESNEFNFAINQKRKTGGNSARVKEFVGHVFLPYERMIQMPEFEWVIGKKPLLPIAWGQRLILRWKRRKSIKQRYFASEKAVRERYEYLKNWGIKNERE